MNRSDQKKITRNLISLRKAIQKDLDKIADKLVEEKVFSKETRKDISNVRPALPQLQCGVFINKLLRSGPDAYSRFKVILEKLGYWTLVDKMEKSVASCQTESNNNWNDTREKTFVVKPPSLPDRLRGETRDSAENRQAVPENRIDEVHQLERMMTIVLGRLDDKDKNTKKADFKKDFRQTLLEESNGNEELLGFFRTLKYNSFSLTSQSMAH